MRKLLASLIAATSIFLTAGTQARAEVVAGGRDVPPVSSQPMGRVAVRRGVQGPAGLFTARINLLVNASKGSFAKPTSLAPDLFYSFSDTFQLGLVHTGPMGWQTTPYANLSRPPAGLCLTGTGDGGCPHVYDNVGLDLLYGLLFGDFHLSFHSSLYLAPLHDPMGVMWTVGFAGKLHFSDEVALFFDPQVGIMLAHRDVNKDMLFLPLELQIQATPAVAFKVLSGVLGQLSNLGDTYQVPLGVGLVGNINRNVDLGVRFSFDNLLGQVPEGASRTDARSLGLLLTLRS